MSKKGEQFYFDNFIECAACACKAATLLEETLGGFDIKSLPGKIEQMHTIEHEGDRLFISSMRKLHTDSTDPIEIIAWREIYIYMEKCIDACEHVADVIESVIMKNT